MPRPFVDPPEDWPYISGQAFRIGYLEKVYDYMAGFTGVMHWNGEQIYDWYLRTRGEAGGPQANAKER